jgi:hypothetical protein
VREQTSTYLAAIADESADLREQLDAMRMRAELAAASEAYLADVGAAIAQMRDGLDEIERTND